MSTTTSNNGGWCNQTGHGQWQEPSYLEPVLSVEGHPAYIAITVVLCAMGMVVNLLVLCVYRKSHPLCEQYGNEYLVNLAAADLAVGAGFLTITAASNAIVRLHLACWEGERATCYVGLAAFVFPRNASLATLTAMAIVTMIRVYHPLRTPLILTVHRRCVLLAAPWLLAAIVTVLGMATANCSRGLLHVQPGIVSRNLEQGVFVTAAVVMVTINIALLLKTSQARRASMQRRLQQCEDVGGSCRDPNWSVETSDGSQTSKCTTSSKSCSRGDGTMKEQCWRGWDRDTRRRPAASASFWLHKSVYITISIIATFIVCNLPYLVTTIMVVVRDIRQITSTEQPRQADELSSVVAMVCSSRLLSLVNAAANFFIYTLRNELFRVELLKFLRLLHTPTVSRGNA